jgi:hypothetical protein
MSYGIEAFAVDFARLKATLGSKDEQLFVQILDDFEDRIAWLDRDDEENQLPSTFAVLDRLIFGGAYHEDRSAGFKYGYALEFLCWFVGESLDNSEWSSMRGDWFHTVDEALGQAGVPPATFTTARLVSRDGAIPIPEPEDFPSIGYLLSEEVPAVAAILNAADWSKVTDAAVRASIEQVRGWLQTCQGTARGLICFYA